MKTKNRKAKEELAARASSDCPKGYGETLAHLVNRLTFNFSCMDKIHLPILGPVDQRGVG